ncbi:hypothetical protein Fcan01_12127 [Folsomia candida]|uniref:Uncharacterized protein n=1 Tax=Folsomia candida TaxID=158441 RepID=A0A226E4K5_FOLCA|nr:hypothetical protein Fcan01_12127 [Folsomia candida]
MMKVLEKGSDFASEVEIGSGVLWLPYKNILQIVNRAVQDNSTEAFTELDTYAQKCKSDFVNFLNYRGKSPADREILKKSTSDGISLNGQEARQILHPQLINETFLLSDIFEINEFLALDLLATAESLKEEYPGWARGLIAVFLYYEGRLCMIQTISSMVIAIPGRTWSEESCFPRVYEIFKNIMGHVFKTDMMDTLLDLFGKCDTKVQLELLDRNLALGDWRHRFEINRMVTGIQEGIGFIIFALSAQQDLIWKETLRILEYLKTTIKSDEDFKMDKGQSLLISSVLCSITNHLRLGDYDRNFARDLLKYLKDYDSKTPEEGGFQCPELFEMFRLIFHIATHKALSETNLNSLHSGSGLGSNSADIVRDDEDYEFKRDVFAYMRDKIFSNPSLYTFEENVVKKYHQLLTDFLTFMPMKVKEMKGRSDDAAKTAALYQNQGFVRPSSLPQEYESFLECIGMFYIHDEENLSTDFFDPDVRHLSLNKFARGTCIDSPTMFVPNAKFLTGLAKGAPEDIFELMKQNGHNFSFEHFFESIMQYLSSFGTGVQVNVRFNGPNLFTSETFQRVVHDSVKIQMNPAEVEGICAYLDLVRMMCENSVVVSGFFTNQKLPWIRILLETAKIRTIPREIRAKMISTAASMIFEHTSCDIVNNVWEMFYQVRLVGQDNVDLKDELDEHEARMEVYPLTISMLKLLESLVNARFKRMDNDPSADLESGSLDNGAFDAYVSYIRDTVLMRAMYRSYKNMDERWEISAFALEILSKLLDYVPQLMLQLLCGSPFLRSIFATLSECITARESSPDVLPSVDRCSLACLNLVRRAMHRQVYFLHRRELSSIRKESVIVGMQELLMKIVPENGKPENIISILKYIDTLLPADHKQAALDILSLTLADRDDIDAHLYAAVITDTNLVSLLRYMFINSLYEPASEEMKKTILEIIRASVGHSSPNIAMMLLGVDKKIDFQNAGMLYIFTCCVSGYPRTVLHAILDNAATLPDAFATLLTMIRDCRLWGPLLRYLKTNHFLSNFIKENFSTITMDAQDVGDFLKCVAVELKTTATPGPLAKTIIGEGSFKFQEILNILNLDEDPLEIPDMEFFDQDNVMQAMKACEYFDPKLKIRVIRVDMLENLLKEEISKLEKNTVLKLRHTVHSEATEVVKFAAEFNTSRWKEASKANMFDGWRQCFEVLVLSTETLKLAGVDFVTSILRILLNKVTGTSTPRDYFCRLAAETVLTLSAVMGTFKDQVNSTTLNVILNHICKWIAEEQSARVRTTLYAAVLHVLRMFKSVNDTGNTTIASFSMILEHICKDCCQSKEIRKMQAMYMMGEIIRLTADKGFVGTNYGNTTGIGSMNASINYGGRDEGSGDFHEFSTFNTSSISPVLPVKQSFHVHTDSPMPKKVNATSLRTTSPSASPLNIMSYMFAKGFLGNLVEEILTVDDSDLVKLFSNQPIDVHMKSLYVFEAKVSLLCRFASTGRRAIMFLMDTNVVHKLADMRVLQIQYFQEDNSRAAYPELTSRDLHNITGGSSFHDLSMPTAPTRKDVMDLLFTNILKLLHSMVDAAPKNVLLVEQIWHFFTTHDLPLSNLISRSVIERDEPNVGCSLTLALLAKIAKHLPAVAFSGRTSVMARVYDILKLHAKHPTYSDFRIRTVRQTFQLMHNYSHNTDATRELKSQGNSHRFRPIVNNELAYDLLESNPEEEVTLGVITKIISDIAATIVNWNVSGGGNKTKWDSMTSILEIGLDMVHEHVELFLTDSKYKASSKKFVEDFIPTLDNRLIIEKGEFTAMLLLRIRRLVHAPSKN